MTSICPPLGLDDGWIVDLHVTKHEDKCRGKARAEIRLESLARTSTEGSRYNANETTARPPEDRP